MNAKNRLTTPQAPLDEKLAAASYVIETDVSLEEMRRQTGEVWDFLISDYEAELGPFPR